MIKEKQNPSKVYEFNINYCRWEFGKYLYSDTPKGMKNLPPKTIKIKPSSNECQKIGHRFRITEERYGNAIMIFNVCLNCGCGLAEVNPPRRYSKSKKEVTIHG